jgi:ribose 5-phosphate isomerase B
VLCISSELTGEELMERMVQVFLTTEFEGGRHARRVKQICDYEAARLRPTD